MRVHFSCEQCEREFRTGQTVALCADCQYHGPAEECQDNDTFDILAYTEQACAAVRNGTPWPVSPTVRTVAA